jgi:hypothetical protein
MVRFSRVGSGGSVRFNERSAAQAGQSVARVRTVRGTMPDGPRGHRGLSALPGRTVRQRLAALLLGSIPPSFLVLPRVLLRTMCGRGPVDGRFLV